MGIAEIVALSALGCVVVFIIAVAVRRIVLARGGSFEVHWRWGDTEESGSWTLGQARFRRNRLRLYRVFSALPVAAITLARAHTMVGQARQPDAVDGPVLPPDAIIVTCECDDVTIDIALSPSALMGLRAWVESRPPRLASDND